MYNLSNKEDNKIAESVRNRRGINKILKVFFSQKADLTKDPIDSSLRMFSIPLAFSFLVNMLYSLADTYWVSRLGANAIAAIGVGEQLLFLIFTLGMGFSVGTGVIVSRRVGEKKHGHANVAATQALVFMFIFSLVIALVFYLSIPLLLDLMNIRGETHALATDYLSAVLLGLPFYFAVFQNNAIIRSTGNSIFPMLVLLATSILNAVISPLLIFGVGPFPEMGIFGAGLGTAAAQFVGLIISLGGILNKVTPIEFDFRDFRINWELIKSIAKISIPAFFQYLSISINRVILFAIANSFGTMVVAAYTLGLKVDLFVFMPVFAIGIAIEIITGQNLGAIKLRRIFLYYKSGLKQLTILLALLGLVVFFLGEEFASIFTDDEVLIYKTGLYLKIMAFSYIFFAFGILSTRVLSGAGATMKSLAMVVAILFLIQIPLVYFLSHYTSLKEVGIWIGILISQIIFAIIGVVMVYKKNWLRKKV